MVWRKVREVLDEDHEDIFMPMIVSEQECLKIQRAILQKNPRVFHESLLYAPLGSFRHIDKNSPLEEYAKFQRKPLKKNRSLIMVESAVQDVEK